MAGKPPSLRLMSGSAERREAWEAAMERWTEFRNELGRARGRQLVKPDYPMPMIGRFEGVKYKARGGFGVVFIVRDPLLDRQVAVKFCILKSKETRELLLREARLMAKFSHPNIVTVHEVGFYGNDDDECELFFVMEHIEGMTAHKFVVREPRPSWIEIATLYRGAGAGLAAAHERGVVHGDFKPSNILLDAKDWPRVTDFGFAHYDTSGDEDQAGRLMGTWAFMAPEVLEGQDADHLSDQWSFCVSLWLTLDRVFPFDVHDEPAKMRKAINKRPQVHDRGVPEQLRALARRGLSVDPRERFPSMAELVAELERVLADLKAGQHAAQTTQERAAQSSTHLELGVVSSPIQTAPSRALQRPFVALALACGTTALLTVLLVMPKGKTGELPQQTEDELPSDILQPRTACNVPDIPFVSISGELEFVCQSIRDGKLAEAEADWMKYRSLHYPKQGAEDYSEQLMTLGDQTRIVARTFEAYAKAMGSIDVNTATRARNKARMMSSRYREDYQAKGGSPLEESHL